MNILRTLVLTLALLGAADAIAATAARPVVLELFTSQGCNSCPPADKLLTKLAEDPTVLALSYHVDYWDYIGWKDAFSSKDSTKRQYAYAQLFHKNAVFTPQLVVEGKKSVIGSRESEVHDAIDEARKDMSETPIHLAPGPKGTLALHLDAANQVPAQAVLLAVRFRHTPTTTEVMAGENKGHALISVNSVTDIKTLDGWRTGDLALPANPTAQDGMAILLQDPRDGRILGVATYIGV